VLGCGQALTVLDLHCEKGLDNLPIYFVTRLQLIYHKSYLKHDLSALLRRRLNKPAMLRTSSVEGPSDHAGSGVLRFSAVEAAGNPCPGNCSRCISAHDIVERRPLDQSYLISVQGRTLQDWPALRPPSILGTASQFSRMSTPEPDLVF